MISSPGWAGRQWRTIARSAAAASRSAFDLVGREVGAAALRLGLVAHAHPDVGVEGVGARRRPRAESPCRAPPARLEPVALRRGDPHLDAGRRAEDRQRAGDVVAVADVGDLAAPRARRSARAASAGRRAPGRGGDRASAPLTTGTSAAPASSRRPRREPARIDDRVDVARTAPGRCRPPTRRARAAARRRAAPAACRRARPPRPRTRPASGSRASRTPARRSAGERVAALPARRAAPSARAPRSSSAAQLLARQLLAGEEVRAMGSGDGTPPSTADRLSARRLAAWRSTRSPGTSSTAATTRPTRRCSRWRSRLLGTSERNDTHLQVNRDLLREFAERPRRRRAGTWRCSRSARRAGRPLADACRAEAHRTLTSRNWLASHPRPAGAPQPRPDRLQGGRLEPDPGPRSRCGRDRASGASSSCAARPERRRWTSPDSAAGPLRRQPPRQRPRPTRRGRASAAPPRPPSTGRATTR